MAQAGQDGRLGRGAGRGVARVLYGDLEAMIVVANNFKLAAILNANVNPASAAPGTMFGSFTADDLAAPNVMLAAGLRLCTKGKAKKMVALPAHKNNGWSALASMKEEWGFTASAKLKRHGLWCTLFGVTSRARPNPVDAFPPA